MTRDSKCSKFVRNGKLWPSLWIFLFQEPNSNFTLSRRNSAPHPSSISVGREALPINFQHLIGGWPNLLVSWWMGCLPCPPRICLRIDWCLEVLVPIWGELHTLSRAQVTRFALADFLINKAAAQICIIKTFSCGAGGRQERPQENPRAPIFHFLCQPKNWLAKWLKICRLIWVWINELCTRGCLIKRVSNVIRTTQLADRSEHFRDLR